MIRSVAWAALAATCGCAREIPPATADPADRVADPALLRLGQPHLMGALEVTRFAAASPGGRLHLAVAVANRSGSRIAARWRFRYIGNDGWELRSERSAAWKTATIEPGGEWTWEGEAEVTGAVAAGMDWRHDRE